MGELVENLAEDLRSGRDVRSMRGVLEDMEAAYGVQDRLLPRLGPVCGRKIAANTPDLIASDGLGAPFVGHIVGAAPMPEGSALRIGDYAELALEPEFAAVLARDVAPGEHFGPDDLADVVARFSLAFEVLDKRNAPADMHGPTFVVNNIFNAGVVLGDTALDADELARGDYGARFVAAGQVMLEAQNSAPQNPGDACLFVMNHFASRGQGLRAGEVILCGAHHPPMPVKDAGEYVFSLSSGAAVSLSISP